MKILNKENFIKKMKSLVKFKKIEFEINRVLKSLDNNFGGFGFGEYEQLVVDCLEELMKDTKTNWISYWLYDLNCGKHSSINSVTINNKKIPIKTLGNLYNILKKNNKD